MRVFLLMTGGVIVPVIFVGKVFRRNPDRRSDIAQRSTTFSLKTDH